MASKPALGITLPVERGQHGFFRQGYTAMTQVKSNLTNLILTKKGERIMQPDFGCNVHNLVFDNITEELITQVRGAVEEAIQVWMPFVIIENLNVTKNEARHEVYISLKYSLRSGVDITDTITLVLVL